MRPGIPPTNFHPCIGLKLGHGPGRERPVLRAGVRILQRGGTLQDAVIKFDERVLILSIAT